MCIMKSPKFSDIDIEFGNSKLWILYNKAPKSCNIDIEFGNSIL